MWKYKRMFTPYECEKKYMDETCYESNKAMYIKIKEAIELPNGDVLIGYQTIYAWEEIDELNPAIFYDKLSEIVLEYNPEDMKEENWD
jgi:hypothetical protein